MTLAETLSRKAGPGVQRSSSVVQLGSSSAPLASSTFQLPSSRAELPSSGVRLPSSGFQLASSAVQLPSSVLQLASSGVPLGSWSVQLAEWMADSDRGRNLSDGISEFRSDLRRGGCESARAPRRRGGACGPGRGGRVGGMSVASSLPQGREVAPRGGGSFRVAGCVFRGAGGNFRGAGGNLQRPGGNFELRGGNRERGSCSLHGHLLTTPAPAPAPGCQVSRVAGLRSRRDAEDAAGAWVKFDGRSLKPRRRGVGPRVWGKAERPTDRGWPMPWARGSDRASAFGYCPLSSDLCPLPLAPPARRVEGALRWGPSSLGLA